jgi:gliding motility-associated-like protein
VKLIIFISIFLPTIILGQLVTNTSMSPPALVQNVLLGSGVTISNVVYTGRPLAIGQFNANGTNLGIESGIVITTGTVVNNGAGPQGPNNQGDAGVDNGAGGSGILSGLIGGETTYNAATLEFDFKAVGDSVSFKYVFGSEEYLEFVNQGFNDVFGLFISGPGFTGNTNIARLPNNTVVSIDNVNNLVNSFYYNNNGDGTVAPFNSSTQYIQYDGFTAVLVAKAKVQCGQTYHLTIAIADVGDGRYDSGIFLEAQSLTSNAPYTSDYTLSKLHFSSPNEVAEGCTSVNVVVEREDTSLPISFPIVVQGTATEGVDFSDIPANIEFNAGQSQFSFNFDILADGLIEENETIELILMLVNECLQLEPDTIRLSIVNVNPINVSLPADSLNCGPGETIILQPIIQGGLEPYTYFWNTNETSPTISVSPPSTQSFSVTVTDACLFSTDTDLAEIFVANIPPISIVPIADITVNCAVTPVFVTAIASGGSGIYTYQWKNGNQVIGTTDTITLKPMTNSVFTVLVRDACGLEKTMDVNYFVSIPLLIPEISTPPAICPGDSILLIASASSGTGVYFYDWQHSTETTNSVYVIPDKTKSYTVFISDECQSYEIPISVIVRVFEPLANFSFSTSDLETGSAIQFMDNSNNAVTYFWDFGNGQTSTEKNPKIIFNEVGTYNVTLKIVDELGCSDTIIKPINIGHILYIPNTFTPDGNKFNNDFFIYSVNIEVLNFEIYNRWGELIFESLNPNRDGWDGSYKNNPCPDGTYTYRIRYITPSREEKNFRGHVNLLR